MHKHVCILLKPFCVTSSSSSVLRVPSLKQHLAYWKLSAACMTSAYVIPQKKRIAIEQIPMFADMFVVYGLQVSQNFDTAAELILHLLHEGILGLPICGGFIHSK